MTNAYKTAVNEYMVQRGFEAADGNTLRPFHDRVIRADAPAPVWLNDDPYAAELSGADLTDHIMEQADVAFAGVPGDDGVLEVGQSPTAPDRISDLEQQARSTRRKSNTRDESPIDTNGWQHAAVAPAPPVTLPEWLKEEPYKVAHREYSTGFYYPDRKVTENTNRSGYFRSWLVVGEVLSWSPDEGGRVTLMSRNKIEPGQEINSCCRATRHSSTPCPKAAFATPTATGCKPSTIRRMCSLYRARMRCRSTPRSAPHQAPHPQSRLTPIAEPKSTQSHRIRNHERYAV